jgi:DNA mismatch repair protein MutL
MSDIQELPDHLVNQIAAGEVIERPASAVKELVENALDARAERIQLELEEGGKKRIRITDDGEGIDREDLPLALKSHATSKIDRPEHLRSIDTLGFRGEALASIASVSDMTITSRPPDQESAYQIQAKAGDVQPVEETSAPEGTRVDVRNLFYCTPARRKFLKNVGTELAHCTDRLTEFAIAYPYVRFELEHDDERLFTFPPADSALDRIRRLYSSQLADQLIAVDEEIEMGRVRGYISPPSLHRPNAKRIYFYLNGRSIESRDVYHAVLDAYEGLIPSKKKPVVFLFLELDPSEVDVNVHPTKKEVRFHRRFKLKDRLEELLREQVLEVSSAASAAGGLRETDKTPADVDGSAGKEDDVRQAIEDFFADRSSPGDDAGDLNRQQFDAFRSGQADTISFKTSHRGFLQVHDMFILEEVEEGILVIDQHALHERVIYHEMHQRVQDQNIPRQRLLSPSVVEVSNVQKKAVEELQPVLKQLGLEVDDFGRGSVAVRSIPAPLSGRDPADILTSTIEDVEEGVGEDGSHSQVDHLLRLLSCHSAIKAGDAMEDEEIEELLRKREEVDTSHSCVHGRPTSLQLTIDELERRFLRK